MNPRALFGLYESLDTVRGLEEQLRIFQFTPDAIKAYSGKPPLQNLATSPSLDSVHHDSTPPLPTSTPAPIKNRQRPCDPPVTMPSTLIPTVPTTPDSTSAATTLVESPSQAEGAGTALPKPTMTPSLSAPDISDMNHAVHTTASETTSTTVPAASKVAGPRGTKHSAAGLTSSAKSTKRLKT